MNKITEKIKLSIGKGRIFYLLILLVSFFPYITPVSFGTDIQPWSILTVTTFSMLLFYNGYRPPKVIVYLLIPTVFSIFLFPVGDNQFSSIRSVAGYFTISLTPIVFYYMLKRHYDLTIIFLKFTVIAYLIVGFVQIVFDMNFLSFLLNRVSTFGGRGSTSLSPEPTFYGIICLFLILLFITLDVKNKSLFIYLLLLQILFIAQSSMAILFLLIFGAYYSILKFNAKIFLLLIVTLFLGMVILNFYNYDIRALHLLSQLITHPESLMSDDSINTRMGIIYFSIKGFIDGYGMPNGFGAFSDYWTIEILKQNIFVQVYGTPPVRIMSFYGSILFELGVIGLLIPISYSIIIFKAYKKNIKDFLLFFFFLNTILFTAIPLSLPLVGVYMAALLYRSDNSANA